MKTANLLASLLTAWLVLPATAPGQEPPAETGDAETAAGVEPARDVEQIHDDLRSLRDRAVAAINRAAVDDLLDLLADEVVFTAMNAEVCRGKEEVRAYFDRMMTGSERIVDSVEIDLTVDALTILYGDDTGIAYGGSRDRYRLTSGLAFEVDSRWSATLVRQGDRWLIGSFHSSVNLFDNPLLGRAKRSLYGAVAVAAIACLLIGFFAGRRKRSAADG